jgi:hypothetical protein
MLGDIAPRDMIRFGRYAKLRQFVMDALSENNPSDVADTTARGEAAERKRGAAAAATG